MASVSALTTGRGSLWLARTGQVKQLLRACPTPPLDASCSTGIDLRECSWKTSDTKGGVIFQNYMRFDVSASENTGFGRIEQLQNKDRITHSVEKSLAAGVVNDQMLGRHFDEGVDLSTGQWQKIAPDRAHMRYAHLLVLDEPTASLDARAEFEVYQRFAELSTGKMAILISHRFSTVRMADSIFVLEGGRIADEGSHRQLVALGGR